MGSEVKHENAIAEAVQDSRMEVALLCSAQRNSCFVRSEMKRCAFIGCSRSQACSYIP